MFEIKYENVMEFLPNQPNDQIDEQMLTDAIAEDGNKDKILCAPSEEIKEYVKDVEV